MSQNKSRNKLEDKKIKQTKNLSNPDFESEFEKIISEVEKLVTPSEDEIKKGHLAKEELEKRVKKVLKSYPEIKYKFLGSFARKTWLKGNLEIDLFLLFPEDVDNHELEKKGLEIGRKILDEWEERYASHPYVHGRVKGVEVDVVPCYRLRSTEKIKSAVDRTPFHHEWVKDRIVGKEKDVRILKGFLKSGGIYGAEYKVRGFSGYLCELLIIHYGSFKELILNGCFWKRGMVIDVVRGEEYVRSDVSVIFVVDPVDSKRNVAANLSIDSLAKFVEMCRNFYQNPSEDFFTRKGVSIELDVLKNEIEKRGTELIVLQFKCPNIVEDNLYTQLERAKTKIINFLDENDFMPLRGGYFVSEGNCNLIFETQVREISRIKKIIGPPFEEWTHVRKFKQRKRPYLPYMEGGRYHIFDFRKFTTPHEGIRDFVQANPKSLGKNIGEEISKGFRLLRSVEILQIHGIVEYLVDFLRLKYDQV